ncbi:MAG TPA: hypothetical protein PLX69_06740 [Leptospiraceae bacterium]|nr:hypothetical protein [Leptospiraceae bacterium]HRG74235.1 hypothetical protein [Leptospiraceae bacterium]
MHLIIRNKNDLQILFHRICNLLLKQINQANVFGVRAITCYIAGGGD